MTCSIEVFVSLCLQILWIFFIEQEVHGIVQAGFDAVLSCLEECSASVGGFIDCTGVAFGFG